MNTAQKNTLNTISFIDKTLRLGINEDDTLKSSSILIYSHSAQSIYIQGDRHVAFLIKTIIKLKSNQDTDN
jgi:hypothetical protein